MAKDLTNPPTSKLKVFIPILILLLLVMGLMSLFFKKPFLYAGTLEATLVDLSSQVQSSIADIIVNEGDVVQVNQELILLSCEDYKSNAKLTQDDYKRNYRLFLQGAIPQEVLDQYANKKEEADIHLKWCTLRSPINGTVLNRYHEPAEVASPGQKLLTLANIRDIWAYIYVPQPAIAKLKVGMKVTGILPEMNNQVFEGKIIKINSEAEFTPKNVQTESERTRLVFGVKVSFLGSNEEEILKPGMTIEINLPGI